MTEQNAIELERLIKTEIPLCAAMELTIDRLTEHSIEVSAPMKANRNLHGSGFAGSLYTLATISGWALVTHFGQRHYPESSVVVREATIDYQLPVTSERFTATTELPDEQTLQGFHQQCQARGRASLTLSIKIHQNAQSAVNLTAKFTLLTAEFAHQIKGEH